ncbi:ABC transporter substrate-binding protein [Paenibacillus sp. NPDC058174]|uniref:ABC transporter substrate-binding protein n=1 Tax=Paenibacillus sp. NPDC058174 TaxID=3346366 RepID=UPI0036DBEFB7
MSKRMSKKWLTVLFIIVIAFSVTACSKGGNGEPQINGSKPGSGTAEKPVEINFWDMVWGPPSYVEEAQKLVEQFNSEHPTIKVTYQSTPWNNWYQTFTTAIAAGAPPDISTGAGYQAFQFTDNDAILPIDDVIEELRSEGKLDDFVPGSVEALKYNGHYVAFPWMIDIRVPFYRKDVFQEAGITELPKTWDELRADLKKINGNGKYGLVLPGNDPNLGLQALFSLMLNNGGGLFTPDKKVDLLNERNVEAAQFLADIVSDGSVNPAMLGFNGDSGVKEFGAGRGGVFIHTPSLPDSFPELADKIGVLEPLAGPHGDKGTLGWVNNIMIYKATKHPDEAKTFLKWWSENNKTLWTEGKQGGFPVKQSFTQDPYWQNNPILKLIADEYLGIMKTTGFQAPGGFPELNEIEGDGTTLTMIQKLMSGRPVKESMEETAKKYETIMGNKK